MGATMIRLKVKEVAQSKGYSMARLARAANMDGRTLRRIYNFPHRNVDTDTLDRLAIVLGVDVSELIESVPDNKKSD